MKVTIQAITTFMGEPRARVSMSNGTRSTDERSEAHRSELLTLDELDTLIFQAAGAKLRLKALLKK